MTPYAFRMPTEGSQAAGLGGCARSAGAKNHLGVVNIAAEGNDNTTRQPDDKASPNDAEGAAVERNVAGGVDACHAQRFRRLRVRPGPAHRHRSGHGPRWSVPSSPTTARTPLTLPPPASRIWSTLPTWKKDPPFGYLSGTSMASARRGRDAKPR